MAGAAAQCYRRAGLRDICRTPSIADRLVVVVVGEAVSEAKSDTTRLVLGVGVRPIKLQKAPQSPGDASSKDCRPKKRIWNAKIAIIAGEGRCGAGAESGNVRRVPGSLFTNKPGWLLCQRVRPGFANHDAQPHVTLRAP
jgi:hypothetical protein